MSGEVSSRQAVLSKHLDAWVDELLYTKQFFLVHMGVITFIRFIFRVDRFERLDG